jgi:hypothetical protein
MADIERNDKRPVLLDWGMRTTGSCSRFNAGRSAPGRPDPSDWISSHELYRLPPVDDTRQAGLSRVGRQGLPAVGAPPSLNWASVPKNAAISAEKPVT